MRLPRKTPWRDVNELKDLWKLLRNDGIEGRKAVLRRLIAWKCNGNLPHAMNAMTHLLDVMAQDGEGSATTSLGSNMALRQAYGSAITRFVNTLVDPLQQGAFARPVAAIAAQISLPGWLVELRHQVTHEDLPSLSVLQEAATEALEWLEEHYIYLTAYPAPVSVPNAPLTSIDVLLNKYKALAKDITKESKRSRKQEQQLSGACKDVDRWLGEAKVAAAAFDALDEDEDWKEDWAMEQLCQALTGRGGLVPVSKKKRAQPSSQVEPPPNVILWEPLLQHLASNHSAFPPQLVASLLLGVTDLSNEDVSYKWTLSGWVFWTSITWGATFSDCTSEAIVKALLNAVPKDPPQDLAVYRLLIKALSSSKPSLKMKAETILGMLENGTADSELDVISNDVIRDMEQRLNQIQKQLGGSTPAFALLPVPTDTQPVAPGWSLRSSTDWIPCPMGVYS